MKLSPSFLVPALGALLGACTRPAPSGTIAVIAHDYAFSSPETAPPGPAVFTLENQGAHYHELFIGLLRRGQTASDVLAAHRQGIPFRQLSKYYLDGEAGVVLLASPGTKSPARATLDLLPDRAYVLFCQLRDSLGLPQHAALGMFRILQVR